MSVNKIALDNQRTIDQLRIENELKTKWLSLIAHDFKGLFSNIQLLIDAFESESITQELFMSLLPELKQIAEKNSKTLENTFEWVKSQTEGFNPQLQDIRVHDLFKEIHNEVIDTVGLKELSVQFTGNQSQSLCTDRVLLKFILKHIIDNAIKYSNKKGLIEVMAYSDSNLNEISITIKDYGMGMKESIVNDVGTLNNSPYTGTMNEKGAGLSLVIVKDFVKLLNGQINVSSIINEGTSITLCFQQFNLEH